MHSECEVVSNQITHFDGAIRGYDEAAYSSRKTLEFNKAGKHAIYTKLFRVDGAMPVEQWASLIGSFFRGNPLIREYFTGNGELTPTLSEEASEASKGIEKTSMSPRGELLLLVGYETHPYVGPHIVIDRAFLADSDDIPLVEFLERSRCTQLIQRIAGEALRYPMIRIGDRILNVPRVLLPMPHIDGAFEAFLFDLKEAIKGDFSCYRAVSIHRSCFPRQGVHRHVENTNRADRLPLPRSRWRPRDSMIRLLAEIA